MRTWSAAYVRLLAALLVATLGLVFSSTAAGAAGRASAANDNNQEIDVIALNFGFEGAPHGSIDAGMLTIHLRNMSPAAANEFHEIAFAKVNPSLNHVTVADAIKGIDAAIFNNDGYFFDSSVGIVGGVPPIAPGTSGVGVADLTRPGTYVYACTEFDPVSGEFHYHLGMVGVFKVHP